MASHHDDCRGRSSRDDDWRSATNRPLHFRSPPGLERGPHTSLEFEVDQGIVGLLIRKSGRNLQSMQRRSKAKITIDQTSRGMGYSIVRLAGSEQAVAEARRLVGLQAAIASTTNAPKAIDADGAHETPVAPKAEPEAKPKAPPLNVSVAGVRVLLEV
eukprot:s3817_g4.t1